MPWILFVVAVFPHVFIYSLKNVITLQIIYSDIENVFDAQGGAIALFLWKDCSSI